jgi:transcriptional regulator with XRE-family HTH domain
MTQAQLAERCGLQQAHIARIENGKYSVGLDTLAQIADAMGAKVDIVID